MLAELVYVMLKLVSRRSHLASEATINPVLGKGEAMIWFCHSGEPGGHGESPI